MKAVVMRACGGPEVLNLEEVPTPEPRPGELLVEVHAVSVNRTLDLAVRAGRYAVPVTLPHVLGVDPSGIVVAVGEGVADRHIGDRVATSTHLRPQVTTAERVMLGVHIWGGYAQYVRLPAGATYLIPDGLDFPTATIVARHAPVAFALLREQARVRPGEWVLVMGAAGGLGSAGVQAARYMGAHVIAAAGSDERVAAALELGAEAGINYRRQDLTAEVRRLTKGAGVQVVFENVGDAELFPQALASLGRYGRLITAGAHASGTVPLDVSRLYLNHLTIIGSTEQTSGDVELSLAAAAAGRFRVLIDRILPLAEAAEAHRLVAARSGIGKVVLVP